MRRFKQFRFSVPMVPLWKRFFFPFNTVLFNRKEPFRFRFRFLKTGSGGSGSTLFFWKNVRFRPVQARVLSGKNKAHKLLTHKLFEKAVNPGTTSRLTRENACFSWARRRKPKIFRPVNGPVVGQPDPDQSKKFMFTCPFLVLSGAILNVFVTYF